LNSLVRPPCATWDASASSRSCWMLTQTSLCSV